MMYRSGVISSTVAAIMASRIKTETLPSLGYKGVAFKRRTTGTGRVSYAVVFTERGRQPYQKLITLKASVLGPAQREAAEMAHRYHLGTFDPWQTRPQSVTLKAAADAWLASGRDWSEATHRGRRGVVNLFVRAYPRKALDSVTTDDIEAFIRRPSLGIESRKSYLRVVKTFFRWCLSRGMIGTDPSQAVIQRRHAARRDRVVFFTRDEFGRFLAAAKDHYEERCHIIDRAGRGNFIWIADLVEMAVATGLRKGELRHLRWCDVSLEESKLYVRARQGWSPKAGSARTVPVFPMAERVLIRRMERRTTWADEELVFGGVRSGGVLSEKRIQENFALVRDKAALPESITFHSARHTFASWLLEEPGMNLYTVSKWLGHRDIKTTVNTYGHLVPTGSEVAERVFA